VIDLRTHADVDEEIAAENRAISRIEEAIDNYIPPTCAHCNATAMDTCPLCERPMCFDDAHESTNVCIECWDEMP
jgi:hypothetical protein